MFNPQNLNRFSYVRNNPILYTDPSGHAICLDGIYCGTPTNSNYQNYVYPVSSGGNSGSSSSGNKLDFTRYSDWEKEVLLKLNNEGGANAQHGVQYILENGIHITVGNGWQSGFGSRGAWYEGDNLLVLNGDLKRPDGSPVYSLDTMPDDWGLSLIVHEAKHIEQGPAIAFSKLGEMEAWQIGINVAENLGWYQKNGWNPRDRAVKKATTVADFSNAIQTHDKPYWRGLTLLLDYPLYYYTPCSMMVFCP